MTDFISKLKSGRLRQPDFIPMSKLEAARLGWNEIDVLLITGDAYVDHPSFGASLIGRILIAAGYRTGIIAQPDWKNPDSLKVFGRPRLCCAVTSGNLDSTLNIYTAGRRIRKEDAYSPGGRPGLRPSGAVNTYSNLARSAFPGITVIAGGIEASMRRAAHYDYWKDKILPSVLMTSKADIVIYGMGEKAVLNVLEKIDSGNSLACIPGTARLPGKNESDQLMERLADGCVRLPDFEEIQSSRDKLMSSQKIIEAESNPFSGRTLVQFHGNRAVVIEKPEEPLTTEELDAVYELPYSNRPHPSCKEKIPAYEMIKTSITAVRGCPGGCSFCGLGLHQGKFLTSRSRASVIRSIRKMASDTGFKGTVSDIGGPTANTYGCSQSSLESCRKCRRPSCLYPEICVNFQAGSEPFSALLNEVVKIDGVRHVFISSGLRLDLFKRQKGLFEQIVRHHVSGHLKVAPEHLDDKVLKLMRKSGSVDFYDFAEWFYSTTKAIGKEQYLVPYFISNFPGSTAESMNMVENYLKKHNWSLQQVQDFMPLPMTMAAAMYYAGTDPESKPIHVNRGLKERRPQKDMLRKKRSY